MISTHNCEIVRDDEETGEKFRDSGGTLEENVMELCQAHNLDAKIYQGNDVPSLNQLAEHISKGGCATVAVNSDLFWHYDDAMQHGSAGLKPENYDTKEDYISAVRTYDAIRSGKGSFTADHFVNVSNAVYDRNGNLTHFIVSDTGDGKTKMIDLAHFQRAYNGLGFGGRRIHVAATGCVLINRRKQNEVIR